MHILDLLLVWSLVQLPEHGSVHVVFPLLPAVLPIHHGEDATGKGLDTANVGSCGLNKVHVPHTAHHRFELLICVNEGTDVVVVRNEFLHRHILVWDKAILDIVVSGEHIKELKAGVFNSASS